MKQIITIFTLISFVIYIGGCSNSYLISLPDLEKQKQEFIYGVQLNNNTMIPFSEEGGDLRLDDKLIIGKVKTDKDNWGQVKYHFNDIKYIIIKSDYMNKPAEEKSINGIQLKNNDLIVFDENGGKFNSNRSTIEGKTNNFQRSEHKLKDIKFVLLKNDMNDTRTELIDANKYKKLYEKGVKSTNTEKELKLTKYGVDKNSKLISSNNYKKLFGHQKMIESSKFKYITLKNNEKIEFKDKSGKFNAQKNTISGYLKSSEKYEVNTDSVRNVFFEKRNNTMTAILFLSVVGIGVLIAWGLSFESGFMSN